MTNAEREGLRRRRCTDPLQEPDALAVVEEVIGDLHVQRRALWSAYSASTAPLGDLARRLPDCARELVEAALCLADMHDGGILLGVNAHEHGPRPGPDESSERFALETSVEAIETLHAKAAECLQLLRPFLPSSQSGIPDNPLWDLRQFAGHLPPTAGGWRVPAWFEREADAQRSGGAPRLVVAVMAEAILERLQGLDGDIPWTASERWADDEVLALFRFLSASKFVPTGLRRDFEQLGDRGLSALRRDRRERQFRGWAREEERLEREYPDDSPPSRCVNPVPES